MQRSCGARTQTRWRLLYNRTPGYRQAVHSGNPKMARSLCRVSTAAVTAAALLLAVDLAVAAPNKLPRQFKLCNRDASDFHSCLAEAFVGAIQILAPGLPEFGIPSLDPLHVPQFGFGDSNTNSPVNLQINLTDIRIHNLKNAKPSNVQSDLDHYQLSTHGLVKDIFVEANYVMNGRILLIPATGEGKASFNVTNFESDIGFKGDKNVKKGKEYLKVREFNMDNTKIEKVKMHFDNLFNGDKTLGPTINNLINENWEEFWSQLKDPLEQVFRYTFKEFSRRIFDKVPMDDIFLRKTP